MPEMPLDLDAIAGRCRDATPGPWVWHREDDEPHDLNAGDAPVLYPYADGWGGAMLLIEPADAAFVEHARTDVPALVARVRELEAALAAIARLAEETARAMDLLHANERHLAFWPMLTRLRDLRRLAERAAQDQELASEGGA